MEGEASDFLNSYLEEMEHIAINMAALWINTSVMHHGLFRDPVFVSDKDHACAV
jgi:hypothetical protein